MAGALLNSFAFHLLEIFRCNLGWLPLSKIKYIKFNNSHSISLLGRTKLDYIQNKDRSRECVKNIPDFLAARILRYESIH